MIVAGANRLQDPAYDQLIFFLERLLRAADDRPLRAHLLFPEFATSRNVGLSHGRKKLATEKTNLDARGIESFLDWHDQHHFKSNDDHQSKRIK